MHRAGITLASGPPGAGKSTPATPLAAEPGLARLSKDVVKEALGAAPAGAAGSLRAVAGRRRGMQPVNRPGAVRAVLVRAGRVLLAKHNTRLPENFGKWGLPGGHIEPADGTPEAALHREMREEFGIGLGPLTRLGDWTYRGRIHRVFAAAPDAEIVRWDPAEILEVRWLSPAEAGALGRQGLLHTGFELDAIGRAPGLASGGP